MADPFRDRIEHLLSQELRTFPIETDLPKKEIGLINWSRPPLVPQEEVALISIRFHKL